VEDSVGLITISTVYLPPKYIVKQEQERFFAGDYSAKHTDWGSGLITPRGRGLLRAPSYWPSDRNKVPDIVDFVIKGIPQDSSRKIMV
jgi:hypothetical protein